MRGPSLSPKEPRHRVAASPAEETNRRGFQRKKVFRDVEKALHVPIRYRNWNCKISTLKVVLVILFVGSLITLLRSPAVYISDLPSNLASRHGFIDKSIGDGAAADPRYISTLDVNRDQISNVIEKLTDRDEYQGIGLLNFNNTKTDQWKQLLPNAEHVVLQLDHVTGNVTWESLYPEWIDEEEEFEVPKCPSLPSLQFPGKPQIDLIAVKLPCNKAGKWSRDVSHLHFQLAAARLAASAKGLHPVHVLLLTDRFPLPNLFTCKDLFAHEGNTWLYTPNLHRLREKARLPVGSSAQIIRMSGSTRDLVILVDDSISDYHRGGLEAAEWKIYTIQRIRNPKAEPEAYNEWNYSKFRLWQLTDYDKIIFIDADLLILRNIDFLFEMPEISAIGNNATLFNSGVMIVEPSNCTFQLLMDHINEIESYNGGDQGYLNEIFTWWHRIPKHVNFLKHFWDGDEEEKKQMKTCLFGADPPILFVIHYLGNKPWLCFRDYDCNWNADILQEFASDVAHKTWWKVHDAMPQNLHKYCLLRSKQKAQLEWDRRQAEKDNSTATPSPPAIKKGICLAMTKLKT
ncbi:UDP-glucuronate:xylan alpha-glucuronosyltransferase 1 [Hibiscus syriacus]|uniref:Hexosyltransferase n=1 Tax=Hibiscus syriacus TaxID=106335 RepID=A0A6A2YZN2_HIBSY|nr:UDP-glucuronate:xylan alpha-glucuronosyltransferase 1 [Hibiscus syriacus]